MAREDHYRKLEGMYTTSPVNEFYRPAIRVEDATAEIELEVRDAFLHAAGSVHGSVVFKTLDDSAFFAASSVVDDVFLMTASFHVDFFRPVTEGTMRATGRIVHRSRNRIVAESEVVDAKDRIVARGSGTFMKSSIRLSPELGYV